MRRLVLALVALAVVALPGAIPAAQADHAPGFPHPVIPVKAWSPAVNGPVSASCYGYYVLHATCEINARDITDVLLLGWSDPVPTGNGLEATQQLHITVTDRNTGAVVLECDIDRTDEMNEQWRPGNLGGLTGAAILPGNRNGACNSRSANVPRGDHVFDVEIRTNSYGYLIVETR